MVITTVGGRVMTETTPTKKRNGLPPGSVHPSTRRASHVYDYQHGGKAGTSVDGISTAHSRVVELCHQLVPGAAGERLDGFTLPTVAVLVGSNIRR
jgi:hypothetical protein